MDVSEWVRWAPSETSFNQLAPSDEKFKLKLIEDLAKVDSWWSSRSRTALCGRQKFKRRQSEMNYHWLKLLPGAPVDTNQARGSSIEGDIRAYGCTALQVVLGMGWYDIKGKFLLRVAHLKFRFFAWLAELWLTLGEYFLFRTILKIIIHLWHYSNILTIIFLSCLSVCVISLWFAWMCVIIASIDANFIAQQSHTFGHSSSGYFCSNTVKCTLIVSNRMIHN